MMAVEENIFVNNRMKFAAQSTGMGAWNLLQCEECRWFTQTFTVLYLSCVICFYFQCICTEELHQMQPSKTGKYKKIYINKHKVDNWFFMALNMKLQCYISSSTRWERESEKRCRCCIQPSHNQFDFQCYSLRIPSYTQTQNPMNRISGFFFLVAIEKWMQVARESSKSACWMTFSFFSMFVCLFFFFT